MIRYLRLYLYFVQFSFSRALEFRLDFFFRIVMDCIWYAVQLAFFLVLFRHTAAIGGWSVDQMIIFAAAYMMSDAINMTVFSNNMWWLPMFINRGDLDYYITRPVSSLFFLTLRDFAANSFVNLIVAGGILVWALARYPEPLAALNVLFFLGLLLLGNFFFAYMTMMFTIPVFWFHSAGGLREGWFQLQKYMERPDQIFPGWLRRLLTTGMPLALIASYPTHALFDGLSIGRALHIAAAAAGCFGILVFAWNRGLRAYSSASS